MVHTLETLHKSAFLQAAFKRNYIGKKLTYRRTHVEGEYCTYRVLVVVDGIVVRDVKEQVHTPSGVVCRTVYTPSFVGCCAFGLGLKKKGYILHTSEKGGAK